MNILIAGDYCPRGRIQKIIESGDYQRIFGELNEVVSQVDYSIVNLECPITTGGEEPIKKCGPNLQCSERGMDALKWAGFQCVTLSNNHFYDYGEDGVEQTLRTCDKYGIEYVGGGHNIDEASKILYKRIGNQTLAIINCCEHEFSVATEISGGSNPLNPIQQYYNIQNAKTKADYVIVIVHGGHEHWQYPSPRMVETYRFFVDAGADAVVNHHQHCFSGYEEYQGKPIFYGLGNFCFDSPIRRQGDWTEGYMVSLQLDTVISYKIIPYQQCTEDELGVHLLPLNIYDSKLKNINSILVDNQQLKKETEKYYLTTSESYGNVLEPFNTYVFRALRRRRLLPSLISNTRFLQAYNQVLCESHRDKFVWWLKTRIKK